MKVVIPPDAELRALDYEAFMDLASRTQASNVTLAGLDRLMAEAERRREDASVRGHVARRQLFGLRMELARFTGRVR